MPVAYLVGRREFFALDFCVTPDVLIPRPETELLVVALLDRIRTLPAPAAVSIADVGTGSGIIAICAAKHCTTCRVTAIDNSRPALKVAALNAANHHVAERIELVESDLFAALSPECQFDYIASNPPYVAAGEMPQLAAEVRKYEPRSALVAGPRGTERMEQLIAAVPSRLHSGGWLLMEIGPDQDQAVGQMIAGSGCLECGPTIKDLAGRPRIVQAQRR
jgi:release factor glutamine methyltransferase